MNIKLLTEHDLVFLSLTGGCKGSSESTLVKMPHCWKSHITAHLLSRNYIMLNIFVKRFQVVQSNSQVSVREGTSLHFSLVLEQTGLSLNWSKTRVSQVEAHTCIYVIIPISLV